MKNEQKREMRGFSFGDPKNFQSPLPNFLPLQSASVVGAAAEQVGSADESKAEAWRLSIWRGGSCG